MTPKARRLLIPLIVFLAATGVLLAIILGPKRPNNEETPTVHDNVAALTTEQDATTNDVTPVVETTLDASLHVPQSTPEPTTPAASSAHFDSLGLTTFGGDFEHTTLGALNDVEHWKMEAQFTRSGAGIDSIRFSNIFETVNGKLRWQQYRALDGEKPNIDDLYLLASSTDLEYRTSDGELGFATASVLGASQIIVNGHTLHLTSPSFWNVSNSSDDSVTFEAVVIDENKNDIARIVRTWTLSDQFGIQLDQSVENLSSEDIDVQWLQYGPASLTVDRSRYMDRRRFRFGWELSDEFDPNKAAPIQSNDILFEYASAKKLDAEDLWPTEATIEDGLKLSWFASTNRYFALAVFPNIDTESSTGRLLTSKVQRITSQVYGAGDDEIILTALWSPTKSIKGGDSIDLAIGVYAGPLKRSILDTQEPYVSFNMRDLVLYQMSSMCAFCTFQWLADFLGLVLTLLDQHVVFDWGIAIIFLVLIVRGLLHPLTKRSQLNMQRFGKVMQKLKPDIDLIKAKYPNDPKKVQSEQMVLMKKYGVNPFQMLGCLPMFLQMPIWVALYALLYFMFDIRQEPAFFGVFQQFGGWSFLADLSAADHFFGQFDEPTHFLLWNITGINILPILMGAIFFVQQKYMSPQGMATTPEQASQQKMMRIMMVVMFPLMLYSAPSGLTLYILTSSFIGILESKHIRKQLDNISIEPVPITQTTGKGRKPKDKQGRAWADAMDARRKKVQNKASKRNHKKRS
jgi:YidC/Oxa1 family membrane protein insertase